MYQQAPPFAIQIEPVQGCNLGCDFCGIHSIGYQRKAKGLDMMSLETASNVAEQIAELGWNPRLEFAMHGEPTLHEDLPGLIAAFRDQLPKASIMVTSNGGGLVGDPVVRVTDLFLAGLNTLALDDYGTNRIVERTMEKLGPNRFPVLRHPQDKGSSPHQRFTGTRIVVIQDLIDATTGTHYDVHNSAGFAYAKEPDDPAARQRCAKPFRELSVRWDGNVALCCNDWPGVYPIGNVVSDGLYEVWHHVAMYEARKALLKGSRELLEPCNGCTAKSLRVGLLPDKFGKEDLPEPDPAYLAGHSVPGGAYTKQIRFDTIRMRDA